MATFDQRRFMADIEERAQTIRRQAEAVLQQTQGHDLYATVRPRLDGMTTNAAHILEDLALLAASLEH